jgi:oxidoreductase, short-chain dehydrogenase/reductase family
VPTVAFWYLKRILPTRWLDALQRASVKGQGKK